MKYKLVYFSISGVFLVIGIFGLLVWGLKPSIDFTGGALLELQFQPEVRISTEKISLLASSVEGINVNSIISVSEGKSYILKLNSISEEQKNQVLSTISGTYKNPKEIRFETVGPSIGRELLIKTGIAVTIASILILLYVAYQFKDKIYGLAAILAMFHDTLLLLGAFAVFGHLYNVEVDMLFVTAVLTTLSFSVHDTIVVFDRIRESLRYNPNANFEQLVNKSITETLSRSLNNSMTIIFMLTALAFLGGITTKWFVVALLIGTVAGTYSSTFTAAPILVILHNRLSKKHKL